MPSLGQKSVRGIAAGIGLASEEITDRKANQDKQTQPSVGGHHADRTLSKENKTQRLPHEGPTAGSSRAPGLHAYNNAADEAEPLECPQEDLGEDSFETAIESLEGQWELDEAQDTLLRQTPYSESENGENTLENRGSCEPGDEVGLADEFLREYPTPSYFPTENAQRPWLPAPVLLPQRRPKNRDRGFIRAYAPALGKFGIGQAMFLHFIENSNRACRASQWLNAINLGSIGAMFIPEAASITVSVAIKLATDVVIAADSRRNTNTFFDKINKEFFQPRGLFCLVMTWNAELADYPSTMLDLNSTIAKATGRGGSAMRERLRHKFRSTDGNTYGNAFPDVMPLVFPKLDQLATDQDAENKLSKMKQRTEFVSSYWDKRAQAQFTMENPDSVLNQGPQPTFTSRYADPTHPASSGSLLALVTGGHITRQQLQKCRTKLRSLGRPWALRYSYTREPYGNQDSGHSRREPSSKPSVEHAPHSQSFELGDLSMNASDMQNSRDSSKADSRAGAYSNEAKSGQNARVAAGKKQLSSKVGIARSVRELLHEKVLYLAIVNMPSEAELQEAREALELI